MNVSAAPSATAGPVTGRAAEGTPTGRTALCWALVIPGSLWCATRIGGWERGPLVQLMAFTPYAAIGSLLPLGLALALRRWRAAVVAALTAAALVTVVAPRVLPDRVPAANGPTVRVLTANLLAGAADPTALVDLVRRNRVDLLALQEYTPDAHAALDRAGLSTLLGYQQVNPEVGTTGSALYSRFPLRDGGVRRNEGGFTQAYATAAVPGAPAVPVESAHPLAPATLGTLRDWRADLAAQPSATPDGPPRILAGDFNATLDHGPLRRLLATGYRDAAAATGRGLVGTWGPYDGDPIPPVTIDHILVDRRITVRAVSVHRLPGSDHRGVCAELTLPSA